MLVFNYSMGSSFMSQRATDTDGWSFVQASTTKVVFVSYETLTPPTGVDVTIRARRKGPEEVRREISEAVKGSSRMP